MISPPIVPMLAKARTNIPEGAFLYEPKWDGFRTLLFRDGDEVYLQSRDKKPMLRYFPELEGPLRDQVPSGVVLDGELVIVSHDGLDFDALQMRIHPAKSRIDMLAEKSPARFVAFDCLAHDQDLRDQPFSDRRAALETVLQGATNPLHRTPATHDPMLAAEWFEAFEGAGFDGVIAKPLEDPYLPGKRAMFKIKHQRTMDCVLCGFRWHKKGPGTLVGSMILGLYRADGQLHQVGVAASFTAKRRAELVEELAPLRQDIGDHPWAAWANSAPSEHQPGMTSRWNANKDLRWEPLRIERVVEVSYNHFDGRRFRHPVQFKRWREDRTPDSCTFDQWSLHPPPQLSEIFGA